MRLHQANQYYICTWYIHWIITSNIVTLVQQGGKRQRAEPSNVCPRIPTTKFWPKGKRSLQQNLKKKTTANAVAPQMSNGFWYPASFVPNKFPLDPLLCPATQLAKNQFHSDEVFYFSQFEQNVRKKTVDLELAVKCWFGKELHLLSKHIWLSFKKKWQARHKWLQIPGAKKSIRNQMEINWSVFKCFFSWLSRPDKRWGIEV